MAVIDLTTATRELEVAASHYEKTAPTVAEWANDLYVRINEQPDDVRLSELTFINVLQADGWMHPNYAANAVYKLMHRLGQDTTGHAGY